MLSRLNTLGSSWKKKLTPESEPKTPQDVLDYIEKQSSEKGTRFLTPVIKFQDLRRIGFSNDVIFAAIKQRVLAHNAIELCEPPFFIHGNGWQERPSIYLDNWADLARLKEQGDLQGWLHNCGVAFVEKRDEGLIQSSLPLDL